MSTLYYEHHVYPQVYNVVPSISAVTGISPGRYLWRIAVAIHLGPRILIVSTFYHFLLTFLPKVAAEEEEADDEMEEADQTGLVDTSRKDLDGFEEVTRDSLLDCGGHDGSKHAMTTCGSTSSSLIKSEETSETAPEEAHKRSEKARLLSTLLKAVYHLQVLEIVGLCGISFIHNREHYRKHFLLPLARSKSLKLHLLHSYP